MSRTKKTCIIHSGNPEGPIFPLTDSKWKKIRHSSYARARLRGFTDSKYYSICKSLPKVFDESKHWYHSACYKKFTAVRIEKHIEACQTKTAECTFDSNIPSDSLVEISTNTGVIENSCVFCNKRKKVKGKEEPLGQCQTKDAEKIKDAANILQDQNLLTKLSEESFAVKNVCYHHSCRKQYLKNAMCRGITENKETSETHKQVNQAKHDKAFGKTIDFVKENIIAPGKAQKLTSIHSRHCVYLSEEGIEDPTYSSQKLVDKLMTHFGTALKTTKSYNKQGIILYSSIISSDEAVAFANGYASPIEAHIEEVALHLRREIFKHSVCPKLNHPLNVHDIISGENKIPDSLAVFFRILFSGTSKPKSENLERKVSSSSQDAIFIATNGKLKPKKHLLLGLGIKSMTGSRKLLEVLNHWGYCISYHTSEEIETELALSLMNQKRVTPENLFCEAGLFTGIAWDNFDSNLETLSGKGTLHDTFGICYQNLETNKSENPRKLTMGGEIEIVAADSLPGENSSNAPDTPMVICQPRKRVRSLHMEPKVLEPYPKKVKLVKQLCSLVSKCPSTDNVENSLRRDFTWMISVKLDKSTPMWAGWNSKTITDTCVKQKIGYMRNITLPPTRSDVVLETMKISQQVAKECGESSILVHYDLAVAKPALQIQSQESPRFDNLFISFGSFHIELAYFGALGFYLKGSGIEHILSESEVLASGSIPGFLNGKHYNRCKRVSILLSLSLEICLFEKFIEQLHSRPELEKLQDLVKILNDDLSQVTLEMFMENPNVKQVYDEFNEFKTKTRSGLHGRTAQFYQQYIDLVDRYKCFCRAYRTNNIELYTEALEKMIPAFFAGKRLNYARWMTVYLIKLLNLETESPEVKTALSQGGLSIKRSGKSFSSVPVDMALEQTVNADAASKFTGITSFANSESARTRWMITRSLRSEIVSSLFESSGMIKDPDSKHDLQPARIAKDHRDIQKIVSTLKSFSNPFADMDPKTPLRNISTGQTIDNIDILSFSSKGEKAAEKFKELYMQDPKNSEKPIPRNLVTNCECSVITRNLKKEEKKLEVAKCTLEAFGKVIHIAALQNCDVKKIMDYPLTAVPFSLAQSDGSMNKTDKSKLTHKLELYQNVDEGHIMTKDIRQVDVIVYDAMFVLHTLRFPETYGALARNLLEYITCNTSAKEVHLVFDSYGNQSIKDSEHDRRTTVPSSDIKVTGADQKTPRKSIDALRNEKFKTSLSKFLCSEWKDDKYASLVADKVLFVGEGTECYKYISMHGRIEATEILELACHHQEADTRIIWHIQYITRGSDRTKNIVVRANDTDVLVLMIYHQRHFNNSQIWYDCGVSSNNSRRLINVTCINEKLGKNMVESLPGYHAFTGSDYTAAFSRQGKIKPFDILRKNNDYQVALGQLGESLELTEETIDGVEKFVCAMYGHRGYTSVSEIRYSIFMKKTTPKSQCKISEKCKGIDPTMLPPSKPALLQKIKRSNFVSRLWKQANCRNPNDGLDPTEHGWYAENGRYCMKWFEGETLPPYLLHTTQEESDTEDEEGDFDSPEDSSSEDSEENME